MKTQTQQVAVQHSQLGAVNDFEIKASAHAFTILSGQLYTDRILAVVREITANAIDAHQVNNIKRPVDVSLPTIWKPTFSVRDYGKGLSPEGIKTLYTTYFSSSKNDSNEEIGGFGLGSKTPFAYTNSFTVMSRHEGTEYTYTAFVSESGVPQITLMETKPTNESGLEVIVAVKKEDCNKFISAAHNAFFFLEEDKVATNIDLKITKQLPLYKLDKISMFERHQRLPGGYRSYNDSYKVLVVMGGFGYELEIESKIFQEVIPAAIRDSMNYTDIGFIINAEIGEYELQPSRESITKTETNSRKISKLILQVIQEYINNALADIEVEYRLQPLGDTLNTLKTMSGFSFNRDILKDFRVKIYKDFEDYLNLLQKFKKYERYYYYGFKRSKPMPKRTLAYAIKEGGIDACKKIIVLYKDTGGPFLKAIGNLMDTDEDAMMLVTDRLDKIKFSQALEAVLPTGTEIDIEYHKLSDFGLLRKKVTRGTKVKTNEYEFLYVINSAYIYKGMQVIKNNSVLTSYDKLKDDHEKVVYIETENGKIPHDAQLCDFIPSLKENCIFVSCYKKDRSFLKSLDKADKLIFYKTYLTEVNEILRKYRWKWWISRESIPTQYADKDSNIYVLKYIDKYQKLFKKFSDELAAYDVDAKNIAHAYGNGSLEAALNRTKGNWIKQLREIGFYHDRLLQLIKLIEDHKDEIYN